MDFDFTPWGIEENLVVIVGWTDFGAGGEFGYSPDGQTFFPESDPERVNCYRPNPEFVGVLRIAPILDDIPIGISSGEPTYDDPVTVGDPWTMTIWEFWITPCPKNWRPKLDEDLSFAAWIEPTTDHKGNPMVGTIIFLLSSSNQPGHCLNDCRLGSTGQWAWDGTTGCHDDFQFLPEQPNLLVFPRDQTIEGVGYNYNVAMSAWATRRATVTVRCLDYGGWAYLMGYVTGFFGEGAARRIDAQDLFVVDIPMDENENHIADYWEDLRNPPSRDPLSDDDDTPVGNGTGGDGLSLYEEYRGLMVRGRWRDFDPWIKDMFVMNFGAVPRDPENGDWNFVIPNEAITSQDGFPGVGVPGEGGRGFWLLNANEGDGFPFRVVNFLNNWAHRRDVYAAIVTPTDHISVPAKTLGPIWGDWEAYDRTQGANLWMGGVEGPPIVLLRTDYIRYAQQQGYEPLAWLCFVIGHELGHTILWHVDHNPDIDESGEEDNTWQNGDGGHHRSVHQNQNCLMIPKVPDVGQPLPTEFCATNAGCPCQFCTRKAGCQWQWKLNP
jgi:hypothetical protein